jgi:hypothetical protein
MREVRKWTCLCAPAGRDNPGTRLPFDGWQMLLPNAGGSCRRTYTSFRTDHGEPAQTATERTRLSPVTGQACRSLKHRVSLHIVCPTTTLVMATPHPSFCMSLRLGSPAEVGHVNGIAHDGTFSPAHLLLWGDRLQRVVDQVLAAAPCPKPTRPKTR